MRHPLIGTYRLQLHPGFTFDDAVAALDEVAALGVSHLYLSPIGEAVPGSSHGYDGTDPTRIRTELGGEAGFRRLVTAADARGLGIVLDIVPHHLAAHHANPLWWSLLREGRHGPAGSTFDIDWDPPERHLRNQVLVPVLGDHYDRELRRGALRLVHEQGRFAVAYHEHRFPVSPVSAARFGLHRGSQALATAKGISDDPELMHDLLEEQHYRLARWQTANDEIDYRRFFDISSLVALRTERAEVAELVTRLPVRLVREGAVEGLRLDHVDGLREPRAFLEQLRSRVPDAWITVEKILAHGEWLDGWPVDGTTGYDTLAWTTRLLADPDGLAELTDRYRSFTGATASWPEVRLAGRREAIHDVLRPDLERVVEASVRWAESRREWRDLTRRELREALVEVAVHMPRYRTYIDEGREPADADRAAVAIALAGAAATDTVADDVLEVVGSLLLGEQPGGAEVVARFQQLTGPLAAKGEEDRALYRWTPCLALGDVGLDPGLGATTVERFHEWAVAAAERQPCDMAATSTHDTKRSEDVRARLAVLTEVPGAYVAALEQWTIADEAALTEPVDRQTRWLTHQLVLGAHPLDAERAWAALRKSLREARVVTSWTAVDEEREGRAELLAGRVVGWAEEGAGGLVEAAVLAGRWNSMVVTALRLLGPGVPDTYQGNELYDLSLVDPDNRRPVDFELRRRLLAEEPATWDPNEPLGRAKLALTRTALRLRREHPAAFDRGPYVPLPATGPDRERAIAFARGDEVAVVASLGSTRGVVGASVELPPGSWTDALTGRPAERHGEVKELLGDRPVAVLVRT